MKLFSRMFSNRMEKVSLIGSKLYLVFEFVQYDLKKYMDTIPKGEYLAILVVKVLFPTLS